MMVISRTPLRVSFVGGGSDLPAFTDEHDGAVVSTSIDKYIHVVVTERFEESIRVSYSQTEIVDRLSDLQHELAREALRTAGLHRKIEIVTIADVPSHGTGLGSSSAVTIGLLNALFSYQGILKSPAELAEDAARIEMDVLGKAIGKQDHYACAFGGMQLLRFERGGVVRRDPLVMPDEHRRSLERSLLMFYTGRQRSAERVLAGVGESISQNGQAKMSLVRMRDLALHLYDVAGRSGGVDEFGACLDENWQLKRLLANGISDESVEEWYARGREAGADGGKLLGAGGGGFLLFYVLPERQAAVRNALSDLRELPFRFESEGSRIVHIGR